MTYNWHTINNPPVVGQTVYLRHDRYKIPFTVVRVEVGSLESQKLYFTNREQPWSIYETEVGSGCRSESILVYKPDQNGDTDDDI